MPLPKPYLRMRGPAAALVALLAAPCAHAQVTIVPRHALLDSGQAMTLKATVQADPESKGDSKAETKAETKDPGWVWSVEGADGLIDPASGRFTAPQLKEPRIFRIQLRAKERPAVVAEAEIRVQAGSSEAAGGFRFSLAALPTATELPFLEVASGRRFDPAAKVEGTTPHVLPARMVGYGLPQRLDWLFGFLEPAALLSYAQGNQWTTRLVGSGQEPELVFHHPTVCHREGLSLSAGGSGEWWSQRQTQEIRVRGVALLAGSLEQKGCVDGPALDARFEGPSGMAWLPRAEGEASWLLVAERGSHAIRALTPRGEVVTFSGKGGEAGAQDGAAEQARFRNPRALLARTDSAGRPEVLVADSGNHAIRRIAADGSVSTLAGVLGQPGEARDGALAEARFNTPHALALEADGAVLVADAGNGVIRRIGSDGQVTTLRGRPGPGCRAQRDGRGELRFHGLNALAVGRDGMADLLFILDGNQLCCYRKSTGDLSALLGNGEPMAVFWPRTRQVSADLVRQAVLNQPAALALTGDSLWIAESATGMVHRLTLTPTGIAQILAPMAGVPDAKPRPGLLLDGLPGPALEDHAALGQPRALLPGERPGQLLVASGTCILRLDAPPIDGQSAAISKIPLKVQAGAKGEPWTVSFRVEGPGPGGLTDARPVRYFVDFIHQDGTLGSRHEGWGQAAAEISVQGRFLRPGTHSVLIRALKPEGIAAQAMAQVAVSAEEAAAHGEHRISVAPRRLTLRQGQSATFSVQESGRPATPPKVPLDLREERKVPAASAEAAKGASLWRWTALAEDEQPCSIDEATGVFTAGAGTRPFQVRVRATHGETGLFAEALVQVLPDATLGSRPLTGLMLDYLGAAAEDAYSEDLPFLERPLEEKARGQRMGAGRAARCQIFNLPQVIAGMGLPFQLDLQGQADGVGRLVTLIGHDSRRLDVTGKASAEMALEDRYGLTQMALETLLADPSSPGALLSEVRFRNIGLLGLGRVAGAPFPGHRDGPDTAAQFRQPAGMTYARSRFDGDLQLLIADPEAHLVRFRRPVAGGLQFGTLCGQDGKAGHRDGPAAEALFNGPTRIT